MGSWHTITSGDGPGTSDMTVGPNEGVSDADDDGDLEVTTTAESISDGTPNRAQVTTASTPSIPDFSGPGQQIPARQQGSGGVSPTALAAVAVALVLAVVGGAVAGDA